MELRRQFSIAIDDKGRMLLPAKLRKHLPGNTLILTKGIERCLWLFLPESWQLISGKLANSGSIFTLSGQNIRRRIIAPAEELTIDRTGRVKLSLSLMKAMGILKTCYLIGMGEWMEIWDEKTLNDYESEDTERRKSDWEDFFGEKGVSTDMNGLREH